MPTDEPKLKASTTGVTKLSGGVFVAESNGIRAYAASPDEALAKARTRELGEIAPELTTIRREIGAPGAAQPEMAEPELVEPELTEPAPEPTIPAGAKISPEKGSIKEELFKDPTPLILPQELAAAEEKEAAETPEEVRELLRRRPDLGPEEGSRLVVGPKKEPALP